MEIHHQQQTRSYRYVVYLVLAALAVGIGVYFYAPKPVNKVANDNMLLFLQNKISDIDLKLQNGDADTDLATRLSWHKSNTALYNQAKGNKDAQIKGQREILKEKIVQVQQRDFPELRSAYVESKKGALDEQNVTIGLSGAHHEVLTFEGKMFRPEPVQEDFMKNIYGIVNDLRFKKVVYKWSDGPDGFHNYEVKSKPDTEM